MQKTPELEQCAAHLLSVIPCLLLTTLSQSLAFTGSFTCTINNIAISPPRKVTALTASSFSLDLHVLHMHSLTVPHAGVTLVMAFYKNIYTWPHPANFDAIV